MCLIAIKPKGKYAYAELFIEGLITSSKNNKDGIGYAFRRAGENGIHYEKGMMNIMSVIDKLRALDIKENDELVVHLRRTSTGAINARNCHPFILTKNDENINDPGPAKTHSPALFHNGHFTNFTDTDKMFSDTYNFCKLFMRNRDVLQLLYKDKDLFKQVFSDIMKTNRVVILSHKSDQNLITLGDFIEDQGYIFSNISYKDAKIVDTGGVISRPHSAVTGFNIPPVNTALAEMQAKFDDIMTITSETPDLEINCTNFNELILIARDTNVHNGVKKDSKWTITKWQSDAKQMQLLSNFTSPAEFVWEDYESLYNNYIARPKLAFKDKYKDYYRLKQLIKPTKTAIKKINDRIGKLAARKKVFPDPSDVIDISYKNRPFLLRYDSICMFLMDNKKFSSFLHIPPTVKEVVVDAQSEINVDKNIEVVSRLEQYRNNRAKIAALQIEHEKELEREADLSKEITDNEKIVQESLERFKEMRAKEVADENSHLNDNLIANKVDSNNGEEITSQEKREVELSEQVTTLAEEGLGRCN